MILKYELIHNEIFEMNEERNWNQYSDLQIIYSISISKNNYDRNDQEFDIWIYEIFHKLLNEW